MAASLKVTANVTLPPAVTGLGVTEMAERLPGAAATGDAAGSASRRAIPDATIKRVRSPAICRTISPICGRMRAGEEDRSPHVVGALSDGVAHRGDGEAMVGRHDERPRVERPHVDRPTSRVVARARRAEHALRVS